MMAKEYIERNALIAEYDRVHIGPPGGARKLMEEAPTADVVEVKRGEWLWNIEDIYECSICGIETRVDEVMGMPTYKHCPNCGAKMDGGKAV